jgi:S-adenosylmethionine:tRNA ribosyltransferase-isomerase
MRLSEFDYDLPEDRIAQKPAPERDLSKLLVLHRDTGRLEHRIFREFAEYTEPGDVLVINDSRVVPARLLGNRDTGGKAEVLLLERTGEDTGRALVRPGQRIKTGRVLTFPRGAREPALRCEVVGHHPDGTRTLRFQAAGDVGEAVRRAGEIPLPPYIHGRDFDIERYQTVYSAREGSLAAPTAGLHFTPACLEEVRAKGVVIARITLHVGIGTFRPIRQEAIDDFRMDEEWLEVTGEAVEAVNGAAGRVVVVGTTCVRALETAARAAPPGDRIAPFRGTTDLFIKPGHTFRAVDRLLTNFHLPRSTLLVLVSAFAGADQVLRAYRAALEGGYRLFSLGDAMLIL